MVKGFILFVGEGHDFVQSLGNVFETEDGQW